MQFWEFFFKSPEKIQGKFCDVFQLSCNKNSTAKKRNRQKMGVFLQKIL